MTDSKAIARVDEASLNKTGGRLLAALTSTAAIHTKSRTSWKTRQLNLTLEREADLDAAFKFRLRLPSEEQPGRQVFINRLRLQA